MSVPAAASASLPDVNAETNPFHIVESLLDRAAYFNLYAVPAARASQAAPPDPAEYFDIDGGFQIRIDHRLHHFEAVMQPPRSDGGVQVEQSVGQVAACYRGRWLVTADDAPWQVGAEPPPRVLDPWRSQRFVMADEEIRFDGGSGWRGYGVGRTVPLIVDGRPRLLAQGVGAVVEGRGRLAGLTGNYVVDGTIEPGRGFSGLVCCRLIDPRGRVKTASDLPAPRQGDVHPTDSFLTLRGQKRDRHQLTELHFGPGGFPDGLITPAELHSARYRFADRPGRGPASRMRLGERIGRLRAVIYTNFLASPGDLANPGHFHTENVYTFVDDAGTVVGTIEANVELGRTFSLSFPDAPTQQGLYFGGVGRIFGGSGCFEGVRGTISVNSAIGREPHALSLLNTLRIVDPEGRFRLGGA